jgi:hypothetical protein
MSVGVVPVIPRFKFTLASGAPAALGWVTIYEAGTTTLTNSWQDSALTTFNTNPVELDANGECLLWLDSTKNYKILLQNAALATVTGWPVDNIPGAGGYSAISDAATAAAAAASAAAAVSAATALEEAAIATAAALRSEQARDAAVITGNIFANTTDGLAGTSGTGTSDRFFSVPVADSTTALILYRNDAGLATEISRYASLASTDENAEDLIGDELNGIAIDATTEDTTVAAVIRDVGTPANAYSGSLYGLFASTVFPSARMIVDEDGTPKWQAHNLGFQSKGFTTASWVKNSCTATALAAASDGEIPYQISATASPASIQQNPGATVGQWYTEEFILEKGTSDWAYVTVNTDGTNPRAYFNLNTGAMGTVSAGLTATISALDKDGSTLPTGRYRCSVRFKAAGTTLNAICGPANADASTTTTAAKTIKVYRNHFHRGVKDIDFLNCTTTALVGVPYDWTKGYRALLIEQIDVAYRNKWGNDLTQADWVLVNATTALNAVGPHSEECSTVTATGANATVLQVCGSGASTTHTVTGWLKRKTGSGTVYLQCNGSTQAVTFDSTGFTRCKFNYTGASAVATFGIKLATSGDAVYVALLNCADKPFGSSDMSTNGALFTLRSADVPYIPLTRFPSGAAMTGYFDFATASDMPSGNTVVGGFQTNAGDSSFIQNGTTYMQMSVSVSGTSTSATLSDFTAGQRVRGTLRVATNDHAASVNGIGTVFDIRRGAPTLTNLTVGGSGGPVWLRKLLVVNRALDDNSLESWQYTSTDTQYLDDVIVARYSEAVNVLTQREPALSRFWDNSETAGGFITWMEKNVTVNPSSVELPARIRGRSWTVDKATNEITLGTKQTLVSPTNWATGLGHTQSGIVIKSTVGSEKGRVWFLWTQLDSANGLLTPTDWRRVYAAYSDDNLVTLSTPQVIYDGGSGSWVLLGPTGNSAELPADNSHPGRIVVPYYASFAPAFGVLYRDPGGSWTLGAGTSIVSADDPNEPTLGVRPDGSMLMTFRCEAVNKHWQAVLTNGGTTISTPAAIVSGSYVASAMSLSQMDPGGGDGRYGKMMLCGARASSPLSRDGLTVEEFVGETVVPSGTQYRPIGTAPFCGYTSSLALSDGLLLVAHESCPDDQFNSRSSIRLMLLEP